MNKNIDDPSISIIMPVYNSQEYLRAAVTSILKQSFREFELLLIDDGSTDDSPFICDDLAKNDSRITVIHKENAGMCAARNDALTIAKGKYVTFCDNDDLYLQDLLKDNYMFAEKYNVDVVRFLRELQRLENDTVILKSITRNHGNHLLTKDNFSNNYDILRSIGGGVWNGLYRRDFLKEHNILFDETMRSGMEDLDFNLQVYMNVDRLYINSKVYYLWVQRNEHSTSRKFTMNYVESVFKCANSEKEVIDNYQIPNSVWLKILTETYIYNIYNSFLMSNCSLNWTEKDKILHQFKVDLLNDKDISKMDLKIFKRKSLKIYAVFMFFFKNKMKTLYLLIKLQQKII